jgi:nucleotide sugar dehydrogenase
LEGKALEELRTLPQIVGGVDEKSAVRAAQMFAFVTPTAIRVSSLETAEMIKLINNTQRDLMFAFANEVADICDTLGVSAIEVIRAGNMGYPRASMPIPGPVGGPCLEKDAYILAEAVNAANGRARLSLAGRAVNEEMTLIAAERIAGLLDRTPKRVAIFGLAFKGRPETSDLRGTLAIKLIADLKARFPGVDIVGYDPAVPLDDIRSLVIDAVAEAEAAAASSDCVIFQNNNPAFEQLDIGGISRAMTPDAVIYDLWSQFDIATIQLENGARYAAYGSLCYANVDRA